MGKVQSLYPSLDSESFGYGKRHYFIDIKKAVNNSHFLLISRSDKVDDQKYVRKTIQLWEEDLGWFVEALSMVLGRFANDEMPGVDRKLMTIIRRDAGMKALPESERPREKLLQLGAEIL